MADRAALAAAITAHPAAAADALAAIQLGAPGQRLEPAALAVVAELMGLPADRAGEAWVAVLGRRRLLPAMAGALEDRSVRTGWQDHRFRGQRMDADVAERFAAQAARFRCRLVADGMALGSGVIVGPTLVLTAWHVVAARLDGPPPTVAQLASPLFYREGLEVLLADGRTSIAVQLPPLHASPFHPMDLDDRLEGADEALTGHDDVALLRLARPAPAGAVARLATAALPPNGGDHIWIVDYPDGADEGLAAGPLALLPGFTRRLGHGIRTAKGSSGGGCFNSRGELVGIHQAAGAADSDTAAGRMVPLTNFEGAIRSLIRQDVTPVRMWSLDGTPAGELVLGRQGLFAGYAAARHGGSGPGGARIRGVWARRGDPTAPASGIGFTWRIVEALAARDPGLRLCRISFEKVVDDVVADIRRRAEQVGFRIADADVAERPGVSRGESAPEAVDADRGRRLALALEQAAADCDLILCFFIDHPHIVFGDRIRSAFEAFLDQALACPHLRLVIAGYESVALPGQHFASAAEPSVAGPPGLVSEYVTGLRQPDIGTFLDDMAAARGRAELHRQLNGFLCRQVLRNLPARGGEYALGDAGRMVQRLRPLVRDLAAAELD